MKHDARKEGRAADAATPVVRAKLRVPAVRALRLERLDARLESVWDRRLGVVVAPAGSGKTTLLASFASTQTSPVAWYRAETWDARQAHMLRHLHTAIGAALATASGTELPGDRPWTSVEEAADGIERSTSSRMLIVIDDLHALEGTDSEAALERLVAYLPEHVAALVASRTQPGFNLPRRRVEGTLLEIGSDDLRFRSWEVERLFREIYGLTIPPQELADIARRTEGWAAGLQLFRLAIAGKSVHERQRMLREGGSNGRFVREYLARNVLTDLPADLRSFLVETCVLGRLSGTLCDGLLGRSGTASVLEELERRQIFTTQHDDGIYRYHEVLRSHLEAILIETLGEAATRERYKRAGALLVAQEEIGEALVAYARAADWDAVERLLHSRGERLVADPSPGAWLDALPTALVRNDPWLILASARRARDDGRWSQAADAYLAAEAAFRSSEGAGIARRERTGILPWTDARGVPPGATDGPGLLRQALTRDPAAARSAAAGLAGPWRALVSAIAAALAGRIDQAATDLVRLGEDPEVSPGVFEAARLLRIGLGALDGPSSAGPPVPTWLDGAPTPWLGRIGRAVAVLSAEPGAPDGAELERIRRAAVDLDDPWGEALLALIAGWAAATDRADAGTAIAWLDAAAERAQSLGAGVLQAWALAIAAVVAERAGDPRATRLTAATERAGRSSACRAPEHFIADARTRLPPGTQDADEPARAAARRPAPSGIPATPSVSVRCFGEFGITVGGSRVELGSIRPRARSVLHLLALRAGEGVHREELESAIWPHEAAGAAGARLQVAISSIRHAFHGSGDGRTSIRIERDHESYRLILPADATVDVRQLEGQLVRARQQAGSDLVAAAEAADRAVVAYGGALLVEEGTAEWVLEPRERYRTLAIEATELKIRLALRHGDHASAAATCLAGLALERYHDPFWRLLIEARELAGDRGAAIRAEVDYRGVLEELGVAPILSGAGPA